MVTATLERTKTERKIDQKVDLEKIGRIIGLPIEVRPYWGSMREGAKTGRGRLQVAVARWIHAGISRRVPQAQNGVIVLWEGKCGCLRHKNVHAQTITLKSVAQQTMLIEVSIYAYRSCFLLGMDDGQPYVVRVSRKPKTVREAIEWLMPKIVKEALDKGLDVKRQGDWYFILTNRRPVLHSWGNESSIHEYRSSVLQGFNASYRTNKLYKGAFLIYNYVSTRHRAAQVCYQSVTGLHCVPPLVKGKVEAPDHPPLLLEDWHVAIRNKSHPWRNVDSRVNLDD